MSEKRLITGNIGLYYCCYRLSQLGWNVMPTARNAKGVDVIAYGHDAKTFRALQIKTLSKRDAVPLGSSVESLMGHFWIVVNRAATEPTGFVLTPDEVVELAERNEKNGQTSYWLNRRDYERSRFREAWERIGPGE